jgi:hypothetical protein
MSSLTGHFVKLDFGGTNFPNWGMFEHGEDCKEEFEMKSL